MKQKFIIKLIGFFIIAIISSCQAGHELHYFKSGDNYFRLRIAESSFASKARYLSGYFDEKAVDRYFGEMRQPIENDTQCASNVTFINPVVESGSDKLQSDSSKRFIMILSTNSDAVAEQIGAFAENDQILESIARLANKGKVDESNNYAFEIATNYERNKAIIDLGNQFISTLNDTMDVNTVKNNITTFLEFVKEQNGKDLNTSSIDMLINNFKK